METKIVKNYALKRGNKFCSKLLQDNANFWGKCSKLYCLNILWAAIVEFTLKKNSLLAELEFGSIL